MPRRPRGKITECLVHVISRGNRGVPIYHDNRDYEFFLDLLEADSHRLDARVHAYCLMSNHYHLLVEVGSVSLSELMHAILHRHAEYINRQYGFHGHLFGDRFWSKPCDSDAYALATVCYIHLNPTRAGITPYPDDYPWSSHRIYLGTSNVPWVTTSLLDLLSPDMTRAQTEYARVVHDALTEPFRHRVFE